MLSLTPEILFCFVQGGSHDVPSSQALITTKAVAKRALTNKEKLEVKNIELKTRNADLEAELHKIEDEVAELEATPPLTCLSHPYSRCIEVNTKSLK